MINGKLLFFMAIVAAVLYVPATSFAEASVSEGKRLGKTCAGCHGTAGNTPGEYIGKIGGQNPTYMTKALTEFADGKRAKSVEMSIVSKGYTPEQLKSIAMYYSTQKWVNSTNNINMAKAEAGKAIAMDNGCMDCHGANGEGMDEYPRIGGQNKGYLYEVMKRYKSGDIKSDEMELITELNDAQLDKLANYLSGIR